MLFWLFFFGGGGMLDVEPTSHSLRIVDMMAGEYRNGIC